MLKPDTVRKIIASELRYLNDAPGYNDFYKEIREGIKAAAKAKINENLLGPELRTFLKIQVKAGNETIEKFLEEQKKENQSEEK